jgi:GT2 family glycosyltransferase
MMRSAAPFSILPSVTVAVCTRDRPEQLARALASLAAQSEPPEEVLVVHNAPSEGFGGPAERLVAERFPAVRSLREAVPGLDFARNRALAAAACDVVSFLDDDAVAAPGWCAAVRRAFAAFPAAGAVTGRIGPLALDTEGQRTFEANGGLFASGTERLRVIPGEAGTLRGRMAPLLARAVSAGSGCNLSVRRRAALDLGGFDEALDLGAALPGGGDIDLLWRLLRAGREVVYEPSALVLHEHRRELAAAFDQIVGHQLGLVAFLTKSAAAARGRERLEALAFLLWRLLKPGVRVVRRTAGRDPLPVPVLLRMGWTCWRGLGAYPRARRLAARRRAEAAALEEAA